MAAAPLVRAASTAAAQPLPVPISNATPPQTGANARRRSQRRQRRQRLPRRAARARRRTPTSATLCPFGSVRSRRRPPARRQGRASREAVVELAHPLGRPRQLADDEAARVEGSTYARKVTTGHESSSGRPAGQVSAALPSRSPIPHHAPRLTEHWRRSSVSGGRRSIWGCRFRRGQGIECHKREVCGEASDP
jgi:hypothetical protein